MSQKCLVCSRSDRAAIDDAIVGGEALRAIGRRFSLGESSLRRHKTHIADAIAGAEGLTRKALVGRLAEYGALARERLNRAIRMNRDELAIKWLARLEKQTELALSVVVDAATDRPAPPTIRIFYANGVVADGGPDDPRAREIAAAHAAGAAMTLTLNGSRIPHETDTKRIINE